MGGTNSIFQNDYQDINNSIIQEAKSFCVNICLNDDNLTKVSINNSNISGNVTIKNGCVVTGASCILKTTLDDKIINEQKNQETADISKLVGPMTILDDLLNLGSSNDIEQSNYQRITNNVTQNLLSVCNFRAESNNNIEIVDIDNDNISGTINLDRQSVVSNTKCTQINMVKNYIQNKQFNSMVAKIVQAGCCAIMGIALVALLVIGFFISILGKRNSTKNKKSSPTPSKSSPTPSKSSPTIATTSV
jgi:hypothetical protein